MCFNKGQKHLCPGESTSPDLITNQRPRRWVEDYYYEDNEDDENCGKLCQGDSSEDLELNATLVAHSNYSQKKNRIEDKGDITSAVTPKHHSSEYRMLHACNCGKTRTIREDPFDVKVRFIL